MRARRGRNEGRVERGASVDCEAGGEARAGGKGRGGGRGRSVGARRCSRGTQEGDAPCNRESSSRGRRSESGEGEEGGREASAHAERALAPTRSPRSDPLQRLTPCDRSERRTCSLTRRGAPSSLANSHAAVHEPPERERRWPTRWTRRTSRTSATLSSLRLSLSHHSTEEERKGCKRRPTRVLAPP